MQASALLQRGFYPALDRAGTRRVRYHDLRHSWASNLLAAGANIADVPRDLGHANVSITLKIYTHAVPRQRRGTSDHMAKLMSQSGNNMETSEEGGETSRPTDQAQVFDLAERQGSSPVQIKLLIRLTKEGLQTSAFLAATPALIAREDTLRRERDSFNQWRVARHRPPLPSRENTYVDHLRPIVLLALNTGMRRGELFHLKWMDANLKTGWLTICGRTSKNRQTRRLPLNKEALAVLETWRRQTAEDTSSPYVFPGDADRPLTTITTAWRTVRKAAGLSDFRFHDLRHHFASRLVQAGVDLNTVRELLGHADLHVVLRYAHLAPGGLASAVEKVTRVAA